MGRAMCSELFTISMTRDEKQLLAVLSDEQGATMSGYVRRLIREAARGTQTGIIVNSELASGESVGRNEVEYAHA